MKSHELAKLLLECPNQEIFVHETGEAYYSVSGFKIVNVVDVGEPSDPSLFFEVYEEDDDTENIIVGLELDWHD